MSQICKCQDDKCPSKQMCRRFTDPVSEYSQCYSNFNREEDAVNCVMFWHNGVCKYCNKSNDKHKIDCPTRKI